MRREFAEKLFFRNPISLPHNTNDEKEWKLFFTRSNTNDEKERKPLVSAPFLAKAIPENKRTSLKVQLQLKYPVPLLELSIQHY